MTNRAAYLLAAKTQLEVKDAPLEKPGPREVLIRNRTLAINPVDTKMQDYGVIIEEYPYILGLEVAGEIEGVGDEVTKFKKGDRVAALGAAIRTKKLAHAGFQLFTCASDITVAHIPEDLSYSSAVVLPLGLTTAAAGLYEHAYLGQPIPSAVASNELEETDRAILIWGGSSSVGSCAIQLAIASGLTVLTTASEKNISYVMGLGAHHVFDHSKDDVIEKLINVATGKKLIGAYDAISTKGTSGKCAEILHHFGGGTIFATIPGTSSVWGDFMNEGLKNGKLRAKPDPVVIQGGLEECQKALDLYRQGVSAAKIVVEL
ncbi:oxidoreductase [Lindgomyces ingoldianus]|uniref:Oxidoreductase n=1 Tax=Lindgomyces ingoldianus TaxID=673940 RepID=A0ACB6QXX2_9PLEO|nr:oxidoreductase [Lindgomyces ingoldianus]KAF2471873.1 oxidoreductase [Lindgomyces ingoldianus]